MPVRGIRPSMLASRFRVFLTSRPGCVPTAKPCPGRERETGAVVALAAAHAWSETRRGTSPLPLLSSFAQEALAAAQAAAPGLPRALLVEQIPADVTARLQQLGCVALVSHEAALTELHIRALHAQGYRVLTYTVNDPARVAELRVWGIDGVITDAVDLIAPGG